MPQVRKGPRLYLYNRKGRDSTWIIRDDAKQIWLCTADFSEAQSPEVETAVAAIANDALEVIFIPRLVA